MQTELIQLHSSMRVWLADPNGLVRINTTYVWFTFFVSCANNAHVWFASLVTHTIEKLHRNVHTTELSKHL
jgi:hypothetical protein